MATYLTDDAMRDPARHYRWVPVVALATPEPVVAGRSVAGWHVDGHALVPGPERLG